MNARAHRATRWALGAFLASLLAIPRRTVTSGTGATTCGYRRSLSIGTFGATPIMGHATR
eukprot:1007605-Alexandrium_andersonii.AAC.1